MGIKYLWDTNTVIYYLQQLFPPSAEHYIDNILEDSRPGISVITEIELLCWNPPSQNDMEILLDFISQTLVIDLEKDIKYKTVDVRKLYKIKLPDAVIGATALVYELTLLSRNISDFENIEGLKIINPWNQ
jgi:predicted nucleic acid-binding protein